VGKPKDCSLLRALQKRRGCAPPSDPRGQLVGVDWNDRTDNALAFIREFGLTYPILRDSSQQVGTAYGLSGLPTTFVLDSQGRIVQTLRGPQTTGTLQAALAVASRMAGP
jgi:peroxiredoxin